MMAVYSAPEDWNETEDMANYAILRWKESGYRTHWEYVNRHGIELCCKAETANENKISPGYKITWLIDHEAVSRRRFVECWHDMKIRDIFTSKTLSPR